MSYTRWMPGVLATTLALACFAQAPPKKAKTIVTTRALRSSFVQKEAYDKMPDGTPVDLYILTNANGMQARIITYGGAVVSLTAPDRNGQHADVVLGLDSLKDYMAHPAHFGGLIGRYGNRIGKAHFQLDGKTYTLAKNNGENNLHGGKGGFDARVWTAKQITSPEGAALELTYVSKDGEEGFPGTLSAKAVYTLTDKNELKIDYTATTDKPTVVNLTNHSYFNLAGEGDVLQHQVMIDADRFTPVDAGLIPTGELKPVKGTPFDFTKSTAIGARIGQNDPQIQVGKGYDHNWVLNKSGNALTKAAEVYEPKTGRVMGVWTTEPGMQFYTGNFLDGTIKGKGKTYAIRSGFCMETQHYPDSPNKPSFPSVVLRPGQTYRTTTVYRFSAR